MTREQTCTDKLSTKVFVPVSLLLINALYIFKKSSEPLIEQQQDKIHSRDVYHTARGVAGLLVMGKRYISRSFHLNFSSNCTVSAKHSVNALKGLINDPMETVTSLKTPSNIIWKNFWRYFNRTLYSSC